VKLRKELRLELLQILPGGNPDCHQCMDLVGKDIGWAQVKAFPSALFTRHSQVGMAKI
jgi:hypothetical protein